MKALISTVLCSLAIFMGVSAQDTKTLKEAYKDYFKIGVALNQRNVTEHDQMALIEREFNSVTCENDMKPESVLAKEGEYTWENADRIANFCRERGIKMRGHCLVWHSQFSEWMFYDKKHNLVKKEVLFERLRKHIHTIVNRYKDIVYAWDVVNEAITDDPNAKQPLRESTFYKICGNDEFIRKAFEYAHEADPDAILFYNDYNECDPVKRDRIYNLVKSMKDAGVPVNGIGMQGHYNIYGPSEKDFEDALVKYSSLVEHVHITELDIRVNTEMGGQLRFNRGEGINITDDIKLMQETQYDRLFRIMRRHHEKLDVVTFWNLSDRDSWLGVGNYPLPFDVEYKPKNLYKVLTNFDPQVDNAVIKEDFVPTSTCQPMQQWPKVNSQGYVRFHIDAPQAKYVICSAGWGGGMKGTVLRKQDDGSWEGTTLLPEDEGFHYYTVNIDGAQVIDPGTNNYYGGSRWMSGVEVPAHDQEFYANRTDIEHGTMQLVNFYSPSTKQMRRAYVYTPAGYGSLDKKKQQKRYPVLYLQHGWGENETSWPVQGKTGEILDNLIAEGKCEPMMVVMTYGMTNELGWGRLRDFKIGDFQAVLVDELIPYIDSHFLTKANRENRAMAGLSMGSMETHEITLRRPEVFGYWGVFSGATYTVDEVQAVQQKPALIFTTTGSKENPKLVNDRTDALKAAGYNAVSFISQGTAHEFLTWRRSLKEMVPMLFK